MDMRTLSLQHELRSVQDGIYALGNDCMRSTHSPRKFPRVAYETAPNLIQDGPFPSFQGRSSGASSLYVSGDRECDILGFVPAGSV